jgi:hypothetical protein
MNKFNLFSLVCLIFLCCNPSNKKASNVKKNTTQSNNVIESVHFESLIGMKADCSSLDFIKLKDKQLQSFFFNELDSIKKIQYPNNDQEVNIMIDITSDYLNQFLSNINEEMLEKEFYFDKDFFFNKAPKGYIDSKVCKDKISIEFDSFNCNFKLKIYNSFQVDSDWCTESVVVYGFKIQNDKIINFWRNEAG